MKIWPKPKSILDTAMLPTEQRQLWSRQYWCSSNLSCGESDVAITCAHCTQPCTVVSEDLPSFTIIALGRKREFSQGLSTSGTIKEVRRVEMCIWNVSLLNYWKWLVTNGWPRITQLGVHLQNLPERKVPSVFPLNAWPELVLSNSFIQNLPFLADFSMCQAGLPSPHLKVSTPVAPP